MNRLLPLLFALFAAAPAFGRGVIFVDNARSGGDGSADRPFATLSEAQGRSTNGDIIYVAEGNAPYEGGITLKDGQMLIGSAYGLDAARVELKAEFEAPPRPAIQGPGPAIHGSISMTGDNVVAGCTLIADSATALSASSPHGPLAVRKTFIRASRQAWGLYLQNCTAPVTFEGGGIEAVAPATGIAIDGGVGDIDFSRFTIGGTFATAVLVKNRGGGAVKFRNGSKITVDDATRDGIVVQGSKGIVSFESPLRISTHGGRGFVVSRSEHVAVNGGASRIATIDAAALDLQQSGVQATFDSVSADASAPGSLAEGIVINKVQGKIVVTGDRDAPASGGTIRNARAYGVRIEQSSDVQLSAMNIIQSGSESALYLRHVRRGKLSGINVTGGGGVVASNVEDVKFDRVAIVNAAKTALFVDEVIGTIPFTLCTIADPAAAALIAEQRFNSGRLSFDRCVISAGGRPAAAPYLAEVRTAAGGKLQLDFHALEMHDSNGSGINADASGASALSLVVAQSYALRLGGAFLDAAAHQSAKLSLSMHDTRVASPASHGRPLISMNGGSDAADAADTCIDFAGNELVFGGGAPLMRIRAGGHSHVRMVGPTPPDVEISAGTPLSPVGHCL